MPIYMDRHDVPGITAGAVAEASAQDIEIQGDYDVEVMTYWVDVERGNAFCLMKAPNMQSVRDMHGMSHGLIPHEIIEVNSNIVNAFLGRIHDPDSTEASSTTEHSIFNDPAFRSILVVDLKDRAMSDCKYGKIISGELIKNFNDLAHRSIHDYGGLKVENHDAVLASFASVTNAVECALNMQESIQIQNSCTDLPEVELKIGLSAGIPVTENSKIFGDAIKMAKRLSAVSESGKIKTTSIIKELYKGSNVHAFNGSSQIRAFSSAEELFLNRLIDAFHDSLSDQEVRMDEFCKRLGVSKSQLYRKTIHITGLSPIDLLKEMRLNDAITLMQKENKNISETTYELGFTNPSYFTKCFKKRYGVPPAEFLKSLA
ncbi:MAG: nickel-binding protein [Bacteroidota bacterium]